MAETCCREGKLRSHLPLVQSQIANLAQTNSKLPTPSQKMAPALRLETLELLDDSSHTSTLSQSSAENSRRPSFSTATTAHTSIVCSSIRPYSYRCGANASVLQGDDDSHWYNDIEPEVAKVAARLPRKIPLPAEYSLDESTEQNYSQPSPSGDDGTSDFTRPFEMVRRSLDYNYHCHYRRDRQLVQDDILLRLYGDSLSPLDVDATKHDQWIFLQPVPWVLVRATHCSSYRNLADCL